MRPSRIAAFLALLTPLSCLSFPVRLTEQTAQARHAGRSASTAQDFSRGSGPLLNAYHGRGGAAAAESRPGDDRKGGIREDVPRKYAARYEEWKREFLSTETGRAQWDTFGRSPHFTLTIALSRANSRGASTGDYVWDSSGNLVAATITLGSDLDEGYPNPIYFPVMNSLAPSKSVSINDPDVLAAAKIAHEFGHLNRAAGSDSRLYQLQSRLIPVYNQILMDNGRDAADPRLVALARQMGGTPVEIWEDREYWGETNAMLYLRDRFAADASRCTLFARIRQSVDLYAKSYTDRFLQVAWSSPSLDRCGWQ